MNKLAIIGAGPAGLACAERLAAAGLGHIITVYESGRKLRARSCPVDLGKECGGCKGICNVISGLGGSMHFGDSIKLSGYPAGRRLRDLLGQSYFELESQALEAFSVRPFAEPRKETMDFFGQDIRPYPVTELSQEFLAQLLTDRFAALRSHCDIRERARVVSVEDTKAGFKVTANERGSRTCDVYEKVVFATGRAGFSSSYSILENLGVAAQPPSISVGIRLEMPASLLRVLYEAHADFKFSSNYLESKVKTFCFSSSKSFGGRIKYCHYQNEFTHPIVLLDGHSHVSEQSDAGANDGLGNFALLVQMDPAVGNKWLHTEFVENYSALCAGRPVYEPVQTFLRGSKAEHNSVSPSVSVCQRGSVRALYRQAELRPLRAAVAETLRLIARANACDLDEVECQTIVLAPEVEFFWPTILVDQSFQSSVPGVFVLGDTAGVAQGNLQATITGIASANSILAELTNPKNIYM